MVVADVARTAAGSPPAQLCEVGSLVLLIGKAEDAADAVVVVAAAEDAVEAASAADLSASEAASSSTSYGPKFMSMMWRLHHGSNRCCC